MLVALGVSAAVLCGTLATAGQDEKKAAAGKEAGKEQKRDTSEETKAIRRLGAAFELAQYGREKKSPELLIAAARVIGTTGTTKGDSKKAEVGKAGTYDSAKEANELLDQALKMGATGKSADAIKTLVAKAKSEIEEIGRGPVGGPRSYSGVFFSPNDPDDTIQVFLRGGETTNAFLQSHTGTDLDLVVTNRSGQTVAQDHGTSPSASVNFYVPVEGDYTFRVINFNPNAQSRYTLFVR
jgi:hypothetical protein